MTNIKPIDTSVHDLQRIPGIGPRMARMLVELGYHSVSELNGEDPQTMYERLCELRKAPIDRCVLYVFRCAVYYASNRVHAAEKLKWWNWKDTGEA